MMKRYSKVLSTILAAAMLLSSTPVTGMSVYAVEDTADVTGENPESEAEGSENSAQDAETSMKDEEPASEEPGTDPTDDEPAADATDEEPAIDEDASVGTTDEEPARKDAPDADEEMDEADNAPKVEDTSISEDDVTAESDFTWDEDGTTIIGYTGSDANVVIPAEATAIGEEAFYDNDVIRSLSFEGNEIVIGESAFAETFVQSVTLPGGTTFEGGYQFDNCQYLSSVTLEEGIEEIPEGAFTYNLRLKSIDLPASVTTLGAGAFTYSGLTSFSCSGVTFTSDEEASLGISGGQFLGCKSLQSVTLENVTALGHGMFAECTALTTVNLPDGLEEIGDQAFYGCTKLTDIDLPDTVVSLGIESFSETAITSILIPAGVTDTEIAAFNGSETLRRVEYAEGMAAIPKWCPAGSTSIRTVVIPSTATSIPDEAFKDFTALTEIDLSESHVTSIGQQAFLDCYQLTTILLPDTLTTIGYRAFYDCRALTAVDLSDTQVTSIGERAFEYCTALAELELPSTLETISGYALHGCSSLAGIVIPASVTSVGDSVFWECSALDYLEYAEGTTTILSVGAENVSTVVLPSTTETIGDSAFCGYSNLTTINLPASIKTIEDYAFGFYTSGEGPSRLKELRFEGDGDIDITYQAFYGSYNATDIPVYCVRDSKVYNYFVNRTGFKVIADGPESYSIQYVLNGGTNAAGNPTSYTTEDDLTLLDPEREGYRFLGWYTDRALQHAFTYEQGTTSGDLTLYAAWEEISYRITYDLDGGALPSGKTNPASYVPSKDVTLVTPIKNLAAFDGWRVNDTEVIITDGRIAAGSYAEDLLLTAQWREPSYRIVWDKNAKDATGTMEDATLRVNDRYEIPGDGYTREGYELAGWNTKANGKGTSYAVGEIVQGLATTDGAQITLYAQWQKSLYEIVYELKDSKASPATNHKSNPDSYTVGQKVRLQNPTRTGYTFGGWYTDAAYTEKVTQITSALGDVTVYAQWTPITYTIAFNANKGTGTMTALTATYDQAEPLPANAFARTGYTFLGWDTAANSKAAEPAYTDGQEVGNLSAKSKAKVTLYAKWQVNSIAIHYELNGGTNSAKNPDFVTIEKNVTLSTPTRTGYTFKGWYTDAALQTPLAKNTIAKTTTEPVTVYAAWTPNTYTLKLDKNGGTYDIPQDAVGKHDYEDEITLPDGTGASRANYEFTGWNTKKDRTGTHYDAGQTVSGLAAKGTVTLYAEWTPVADQTYTITYHGIDDSWDNSKNPDAYSFEKDVKLVNPTREGYTFGGWYAEDPEVNPKAKKVTSISKKTTGAVEVYGVWTENTYTIAYNGNKGSLPKGVKMNAQTALYSEDIDLTANAFTRKGYEFTGWNTQAKGTGDAYADEAQVSRLMAKNKGKVTMYAQWQAIEYSITYDGAEDGTDGVGNTNPTTYTIEQDVKLVNPTAYGYTFKGWYAEDPTVNAKAKKVTKIAKATADDVTVYAQWSENRYNLRFSGASVHAIVNKLYTETFTIPATAPEKSGYTFKGWALTRGGEVVCRPGETVTFKELHENRGTARGLVGTKYFTLYAVFEEN